MLFTWGTLGTQRDEDNFIHTHTTVEGGLSQIDYIGARGPIAVCPNRVRQRKEFASFIDCENHTPICNLPIHLQTENAQKKTEEDRRQQARQP